MASLPGPIASQADFKFSSFYQLSFDILPKELKADKTLRSCREGDIPFVTSSDNVLVVFYICQETTAEFPPSGTLKKKPHSPNPDQFGVQVRQE